MGTPALGKTRWRRFALAFGIPSGVIAAMLALVATGVLALPVTISGVGFTLSGDQLHAQNFSQNGDVDICAITAACPDVATGAGALSGAHIKGVAVTTIGTLNNNSGHGIVNLDQVVCGPTGFGSPAFMKLELKGDTVTATNLVSDITGLSTNSDTLTTFNGLKVGIPATNRAGQTTFGQTADTFDIGSSSSSPSFKQSAVYTTAGSFAVKHLSLSVSFVSSCG